jgi:phage terminase small subunit
MPVLSNHRWELFSQELAKGKTGDEAYQLAGYKENRHNASRLKTNETISARVLEIMGRAANRTELSISSVTESLLRIAEKAEQLGEAAGLGVAKAAWMDAAKVNGLIVEQTRSENTNVNYAVSDEPPSEQEWTDQHVTSH